MNKLDDLIKILKFCKENEEFISAIDEDTTLCAETFDDLGIDIILKTDMKFSIYNNCYEIDGVEFQYNDIEEVLKNLKECCSRNIKIDDVVISMEQVEKIYDFYLQKTVKVNDIDKFYDIKTDMDNKSIKEMYISKFIEDIKECKLSVCIFKDFKDLVYYLYVDGLDEQQITDNIVNLAKFGFDIEKCGNILKLDDMYVLIDF